MSKLITIIGSSGSGKTSLVHALSKKDIFATAYEQHTERPFQALAKQDSRYTFANQMDYLILRAEQEKELRASPRIGLMDGGLDLDFHGFTRLFLSRNLLSQKEFDLCRRFYRLTRELLPEPELIVRLIADEETVAGRLSRRKRINIANAEDTALFESYLDEWLASISSNRILQLDVSNETLDYAQSVSTILDTIEK
ncbi:MAG: deoxynucleoside kinase, partial [Anaerolineales bacterium]|nr:deoxynucleoside kinase [Anaerolineales bacterium]